MSTTPAQGGLEPVVRTLKLPCDPPRAFGAFADEIHAWWPAAFTASGESVSRVVIESRTGGRVYEVNVNGGEFDWGSVTAWEPGHRLVLSWTLAIRTGSATELEVSFAGDDAFSTVRLEHRGWSAEQGADRSRFDDDGGWSVVLAAYQAFIEEQHPAP